MRLFAAAVTAALVLIPVQGQAQQKCVTAVGSCAMTVASTVGARCYCITPNGPVAGTVQSGSASAPIPFNRTMVSYAGQIRPAGD